LASVPDGLLIVDKPAGPTSHDIVDLVRKVLGVRRVGHTGTLDPFATGVLPVCVGKTTRLARFLAESDKSYLAEVRFGFATTTDDLHGERLPGEWHAEGGRIVLEADALEAACRSLRGEVLQRPPAFSAKRVGGKRLYQLARDGIVTERPAIAVRIDELTVLRIDADRAELQVRCSAGTYVRSIARDLGKALGCGAHLVSLRRTAAAGVGLAQAIPAAALTREQALAALVPPARVLPQLPAIRVSAEGRTAARHGRLLTRALLVSGFPEGAAPERVRVLDENEELIGLAVPKGFGYRAEGLRVEAGFHPDVVLIG
jgi:tRNA pseudouridine55 synthase